MLILSSSKFKDSRKGNLNQTLRVKDLQSDKINHKRLFKENYKILITKLQMRMILLFYMMRIMQLEVTSLILFYRRHIALTYLN